MDWTDFDRDGQATIQLSVSTSHGRATPLVWKTIKKSELKYQQFKYEREVLETLKKHIGDVKVTILADRGFGDIEHYYYIKEDLGFDFIIRFRSNIHVTNEEGKIFLASEWVPKDNTMV